ncbi:MAG: ribonuclease R [Oxalobacter sp.]|nr:ribonuclease R [Oxalobacter sp.]
MKKYPYPIPSREEIMDALRQSSRGYGVKTLAKELQVKTTEFDGFLKRLDAMVRDGQIVQDAKGSYKVNTSARFITGYVQGHPEGFGFLIRDDGEEPIYLPEKEMYKVMPNDRAEVRIAGYDSKGRPEGFIVTVTARSTTHVVGRLVREEGVWRIAPEDRRIAHDILLDGRPGKAREGQYVNAELTSQPTRYAPPMAKIVEVLGNREDSGIEIEIAVRKFGLPYVFSPDALQQADALPDTVLPEEAKGRIDLRDIPLVTIDGEDARDFDDAVYCMPVTVDGNDGYRLVVAIADVSHYVQPGTPLDGDALSRATSTYFPRRVIPMLPEKLSNGICSLNPDVDRLVMVCDAVISSGGKVTAYQFYPAVMHSAARLTYTTVFAILQNPTGPEAVQYRTLVPHLQDLYGLYHVLAQARERRGAIDFETVETEIICDDNGKIEKILPRERNDAHKLIEECMLVANVCAADFIAHHQHEGLYRVHAHPSIEKLQQVRAFLALSGITLGGGDSPEPTDYASAARQFAGRPDATILQTMLLRSMQQAVYTPDNVGHFGLAFDAYMHFTSPIRRYPDLLTHRVIKAILSGKKYVPKGIERKKLNLDVPASIRKQVLQQQGTGGKDRKVGRERAVWEMLGLHCSANERRADDASYDVEQWLKCWYMRDKLGEEFMGSVASVTAFGVFVQLDDLYVEGLVHVTDLGQDYFHYDDIRRELRGERSGVSFRLADKVKVQVSRVNLDARQIDFRLVEGPFHPTGNHADNDGAVRSGQDKEQVKS